MIKIHCSALPGHHNIYCIFNCFISDLNDGSSIAAAAATGAVEVTVVVMWFPSGA